MVSMASFIILLALFFISLLITFNTSLRTILRKFNLIGLIRSKVSKAEEEEDWEEPEEDWEETEEGPEAAEEANKETREEPEESDFVQKKVPEVRVKKSKGSCILLRKKK